jgi:hypothetical protein
MGGPKAAAPASPAKPSTVVDYGTEGVEPTSGKKAKKGPGVGVIEARNATAFAQALEGMVGLRYAANQCANSLRDAGKAAKVNLGVSLEPYDRSKALGMPQGAGYAASFFGPGVGKYIAPDNRQQVRPGDIVILQNTMEKFGSGIVTHVGGVVKALNGAIEIVHASSGAARRQGLSGAVMARESLDAFRPDQIVGFIRPYAMDGVKAIGATSEAMKKWSERVQAFMAGMAPQGSAFDTKHTELVAKQAKEIAEGQSLFMSPEVMQAKFEQHQQQLLKLANEEVISKRGLTADLQASALEAEGSFTEARILRIREETARAIDAINDSQMLTPSEKASGVSSATTIGVRSEVAAGNEAGVAVESDIDRMLASMGTEIDARFEDINKLRALNQITADEQMQRVAAEIDSLGSVNAVKHEQALQYQELYRTHWTERLAIDAENAALEMEQMAAHLQESGDIANSQQLELTTIQAMLSDQRRAKLLQEHQAVMAFAQGVENNLTQALTGLLAGTQTFKDAFTALWKGIASAVIAEIAKMIAKMLVMKAIQFGLGLFTGGATAGWDIGGMTLPGELALPSFHEGGVVGRPNLRPDEVIARLKRDEVVLNDTGINRLNDKSSEQPASNYTINVTVGAGADGNEIGRDIAREMKWQLQGG